MIKNTKKIKDSNIVSGYEVGNLKMVVQAIPDKDKEGKPTGRLVKGVFCTLNVKKIEDDKKESINFIFTLDSSPTFKKAILSMINEAIGLKLKANK